MIAFDGSAHLEGGSGSGKAGPAQPSGRSAKKAPAGRSPPPQSSSSAPGVVCRRSAAGVAMLSSPGGASGAPSAYLLLHVRKMARYVLNSFDAELIAAVASVVLLRLMNHELYRRPSSGVASAGQTEDEMSELLAERRQTTSANENVLLVTDSKTVCKVFRSAKKLAGTDETGISRCKLSSISPYYLSNSCR